MKKLNLFFIVLLAMARDVNPLGSEIIKLMRTIREQEKAIAEDKKMIESCDTIDVAGHGSVNIADFEKFLADKDQQDPEIIKTRERFECFLECRKEADDTLKANLEILEKNKATLNHALGL